MSTRVTLAIVSFVVLIVHGIVFYDQFFTRGEKHQACVQCEREHHRCRLLPLPLSHEGDLLRRQEL